MTKRKLFYIEEDQIYIYDFGDSRNSVFFIVHTEEYCERHRPKVNMTPKTKEKLEKILSLYEAAQNYIEWKIIQAL